MNCLQKYGSDCNRKLNITCRFILPLIPKFIIILVPGTPFEVVDVQVLVVDGDSVELEETHVVLFDGAWSKPENEAEVWSEADSLGGLPQLDHVFEGVTNRHHPLCIHEGVLSDQEFDDGLIALEPEVEAVALAGEVTQSWNRAVAHSISAMLLHHLEHT